MPVLFLLFLGAQMHAQDPVFVAKTSGTKVAQHSVLSIQFELKNASSSQFQPPFFKDFRVVGGPSTSSSTMIVNGVVSQSQSWTYSILATKQGKQTIDGAKVIVNGKPLKANPVVIEVVAPADLASQSSATDTKDPVFLRAELNDSVYYPGQQIIMNYKLLFKENVQTVNPIAEDDYTDFFVQPFSNLNPLAEYETINGQQYTSRVIKSIALYAHQSGIYELDPLILSAGINSPFETDRGFFGMRRMQNIQVASSPVTIHVESLPTDAPDSFSGAVGQYQMRVSQGRSQISTNDAFTFQLEITGNGDARRWALPAAVVDGDFEVYEPKILKEENFELNEQINQRKTIVYQMIPAAPGNYSISVPFTFFDPSTKTYSTIYSDTMNISATQGQKKSRTVDADSKESFVPDLMAVSPPWFKDKFWLSIPHLLLFGLFLTGSGVGFVRVWRQVREQDIPEALRIRRDAAQKALEKLRVLETSMEGLPLHEFYGTATEIFYSFLMDRFTIPSSELDEAGLVRYLTESKIDASLADRTKTFFGQCLSVRYGGTPGGFSRSEMMRVSRELISALHE